MSQPTVPGQENSIPPTAWPPQQPVQQQYAAQQPGEQYAQQAPQQQAYGGQYTQPPYGAQPYAMQRPARTGPGIFDIDFWLPKIKVVAAIALIVPVLFGIIWFIYYLVMASNPLFSLADMANSMGMGGYYDYDDPENAVLSIFGSLKGMLLTQAFQTLVASLVTGLLSMLGVLAAGKALQNIKEIRDRSLAV